MTADIWFGLLLAVVLLFGFVAFFGAPYVPTFRRDLRTIFRTLCPLSKGDVLVDLGSGDGVVLREAARHGASAIGYELNPALVWLSKWLSRRQGNITIHTANMWQVALPAETTVVYIFAVERDVKRVAQKMQDEANRLGKPLKMISHGFTLPDKTPVKQVGAHFLYDFIPLQSEKTQV